MSNKGVLLFLVLSLVTEQALSAGEDRQVQVQAGELKWEQPFGPNGPSRANVAGDRLKGPYTVFLRLPAGYDSGWHTHDTRYTAVVLSGTVENVEQGEPERAHAMRAGSVWTQPGRRNHVTRCQAGAECLIFVTTPGGESYHPMTAAGRPVTPPTK